MARAQVDLQDVLLALRTERGRIGERFGIDVFGVSGSLARGEHDVRSDVDVAARPLRRIGLFDVHDASMALRKLVGTQVDVVFPDDLPDYRRESFLRDLLPL